MPSQTTLEDLLPWNRQQGKNSKRFPKKEGMLKLAKRSFEGGSLNIADIRGNDQIALGLVVSVVLPNVEKTKSQSSINRKGVGGGKIGYRVLVREWDKHQIDLSLTVEKAAKLDPKILPIYYPQTLDAEQQRAAPRDVVLVARGGRYLGKTSSEPQVSQSTKTKKRNFKRSNNKKQKDTASLSTSAPDGDKMIGGTPFPNSQPNCGSWEQTLGEFNPYRAEDIRDFRREFVEGRSPRGGNTGAGVPLAEDTELLTIVQNVENGEYLSQFYPALQQQIQQFQFSSAAGNVPYPSYNGLPPFQRVTTQGARFGPAAGVTGDGFANNQQFIPLPPGQEVRQDVNEAISRVGLAINSLGARLIIESVDEQITESAVGFAGAAGKTIIKTTINLNKNSSSLLPSRRGYFDFDYLLTKDELQNSRGRFYFNVWAISDLPLGTTYIDQETGQEFKVETLPLVKKGGTFKPNVLVCRNADEFGSPLEEKLGLFPATREVYQANVVNLTKIMKANGFSRSQASRPWKQHCNPRLIPFYTNFEEYSISPRWNIFTIKRTYFDPLVALENARRDLGEENVDKWSKEVQNWIDAMFGKLP
jgi:hypothetical protein